MHFITFNIVLSLYYSIKHLEAAVVICIIIKN